MPQQKTIVPYAEGDIRRGWTTVIYLTWKAESGFIPVKIYPFGEPHPDHGWSQPAWDVPGGTPPAALATLTNIGDSHTVTERVWIGSSSAVLTVGEAGFIGDPHICQLRTVRTKN